MAPIIIIYIVLLLSGCVPGIDKEDRIEVGTIVSKTVFGIQAGESVSLINADLNKISFHNRDIENLVDTGPDSVTISQAAENQLNDIYSQITYKVKVRLCIQRSVEEYIVDREFFNSLRLGVISKFIYSLDGNSIDSLIAY